MRYIAAYALARMAGNETPTADDIITIIGSVGIEAEMEQINMVLKLLNGRDFDDVMEEGRKQLANVTLGGVGAQAAVQAPQEQVTEEKTEATAAVEEDSDSDSDFGIDLFG